MEGNILSQGVSEVYVIKDMLVTLSQCKEKRDELEVEEDRLEKSIYVKEKVIQDEVTNTIKKRKDEIEATYNIQLDKTKAKIKKIKSKKEKSKDVMVKERIELETKGLCDEHEELLKNFMDKIKDNKIPGLCKFNLFYSLFMAKYFSDFLIIAVCLLFLLYIIPCGIYFLLLPEQKIIYLVAIYSAIVIIPGGIYMLIENSIKDKYIITLKELQIIRDRIKENKKSQKKVMKGIRRDKDESIYDLHHFDDELNSLTSELNGISDEKQGTLKIFEQETRQIISNEIKARHEEELQSLKLDHKKAIEERKSMEERIRNVSLNIANSYEVYLGKEMMSLEQLDRLANVMTERQLKTISEGLANLHDE